MGCPSSYQIHLQCVLYIDCGDNSDSNIPRDTLVVKAAKYHFVIGAFQTYIEGASYITHSVVRSDAVCRVIGCYKLF